MHRQQLLQLLARYRTSYLEEAAMVERTRRFILRHENCFDRSLKPGHVTASAWVVDPARRGVMPTVRATSSVWR